MTELFASLLGGSAAGLVVIFLAKSWIESRIKSSIEHEYNKHLEIYKRQLDQKDKIELVSVLLAEWIKYPTGEVIPKDQRNLLNKLSFQTSLWLPTELAVELNKVLQLRDGRKSIFEVILLARKLLTGDESLPIDLVTYWKPGLEQVSGPVSQIS